MQKKKITNHLLFNQANQSQVSVEKSNARLKTALQDAIELIKPDKKN